MTTTSTDAGTSRKATGSPAKQTGSCMATPSPPRLVASRATETTSRRQADRPADVCKLILLIRGTAYSARPVPCETGRAWRLKNSQSGKVYDVAEEEFGPTCTCADATYRHDGRDGTFCKHIRACSALNLITLTMECNPRTWPRWTDAACYAPGRR